MVDPTLVTYVKDAVAKGRAKEEIYKELLSQGWTIEVIESCFAGTTTQEDKDEASKKTIRVILAIGAILIGAGVFSFVAAYWQLMSDPVRVGVILFFMIVSYAAGWYVKEKSGLLKTGEALIFLGAVIYGAGIFLVAQIFHIRAEWPDGLLLWMFGAIAMAFAAEAYSLFYLAILLGVCALIGHPFSMFSAFGHNPYLLTSSFLLLASTAVTFFSGWIIRRKVPAGSTEPY